MAADGYPVAAGRPLMNVQPSQEGDQPLELRPPLEIVRPSGLQPLFELRRLLG